MKTKGSKSLGVHMNGNRMADIRTCTEVSTGKTLYYFCIPSTRVYISEEEYENEWRKL